MPDSEVLRRQRCGIYTRVGTRAAREGWQPTHDKQRELCVAYVRQLGWSVHGYYQDHEVSGATMTRPALRRLLADVAAKQLDVVVAATVNRLSRRYFHFATIMADLLFVGAGLVCVGEGFSTLEPAGQRTLSMMLSLAYPDRVTFAPPARGRATR